MNWFIRPKVSTPKPVAAEKVEPKPTMPTVPLHRRESAPNYFTQTDIRATFKRLQEPVQQQRPRRVK